MDEIYLLTSVNLRDGKKLDCRCWRWGRSKEEMIYIAQEYTDSYALYGTYTHIVIERVPYEGLPYDEDPTWLEIRNLDNPVEEIFVTSDGEEVPYKTEYEAVVLDRPPEGTESIVGWVIG